MCLEKEQIILELDQAARERLTVIHELQAALGRINAPDNSK